MTSFSSLERTNERMNPTQPEKERERGKPDVVRFVTYLHGDGRYWNGDGDWEKGSRLGCMKKKGGKKGLMAASYGNKRALIGIIMQQCGGASGRSMINAS